MLDYGKPPILVEVAEADIVLENAQRGMKVWSIGPEGNYNGAVPAIYEDGKLKFHIGDDFPSLYYLITME